MWKVELAEAAIKLGKGLLPSAERAGISVSNLLEDSGILGSVFKRKIAGGLPELGIDAAGAESKLFGTAVKPVDMHVSKLPELNIQDVDPGRSWKPKGLWASDKLEWVPQSGISSPSEVVRGFAHHVDVNDAHILDIRTPENLQSLIRNYGRPSEFPSSRENVFVPEALDLSKVTNLSERDFRAFKNSDVDWTAMAKEYDGIRFSGYGEIKENHQVPSWFDGLDMNSSVTWNNVGKVKVTPLGRVPSYYEPSFEDKLKAIIERAGQIK